MVSKAASSRHDPSIRYSPLTIRHSPLTSSSFHHHRRLHMGMKAAEIFVRSRRRKGEGELVIGVERLRSERLAAGDHGVQNVVLVDPGHRGPDLHVSCAGAKAKSWIFTVVPSAATTGARSAAAS